MFIAAILCLLIGCTAARFATPPSGELRASIGQQPGSADGRGRALGETVATEPGYGFPLYASSIKVPIDHFKNDSRYEPHSDGYFDLHYFYDARYYKPGGPVIMLLSGEVPAKARIPFLHTGIVNILARNTQGLGVILEHRYYGSSIPVPNYSTENMRFLTTEQAMADAAYFAKNVQFYGANITKEINPPETPWITYGGSYAGALSSFLRVEYPDIFWGAIGSSAVTQAIWDYWYYYEPIRRYGPPDCIDLIQQIIGLIDQILATGDTARKYLLKGLFGLQTVMYDDDFVNTLTYGVGSWQQLNWDPAVSDNSFIDQCNNVTSNQFLYAANTSRDSLVLQQIIHGTNITPISGTLSKAFINFAGWNGNLALQRAQKAEEDVGLYYGNHDTTFYNITMLPAAGWRAWPYQFCTEWGFLQTGSGVPKGQPTLISRLITQEYMSMTCQQAFGLSKPADTDRVNRYGGSNINYDRLALVDGELDPWRYATAHSPNARNRSSTPLNPFVLIEEGVHHWDENGVMGSQFVEGRMPPSPVGSAQDTLVDTVLNWLSVFRFQVDKPTESSSEANVTTSSLTNGGNQPGSPPTNWENAYSNIPDEGANGTSTSNSSRPLFDVGTTIDVIQDGMPPADPSPSEAAQVIDTFPQQYFSGRVLTDISDQSSSTENPANNSTGNNPKRRNAMSRMKRGWGSYSPKASP